MLAHSVSSNTLSWRESRRMATFAGIALALSFQRSNWVDGLTESNVKSGQTSNLVSGNRYLSPRDPSDVPVARRRPRMVRLSNRNGGHWPPFCYGKNALWSTGPRGGAYCTGRSELSGCQFQAGFGAQAGVSSRPPCALPPKSRRRRFSAGHPFPKVAWKPPRSGFPRFRFPGPPC